MLVKIEVCLINGCVLYVFKYGICKKIKTVTKNLTLSRPQTSDVCSAWNVYWQFRPVGNIILNCWSYYCNVTGVSYCNNYSNRNLKWKGFILQNVQGCLKRSLLLACLARNTSRVFVAASHQTRLDTRSKARRPIKVGIKGRGRSGTSRDSNPACLCCSSAHLVQCEPDEASSFTNPNVGPGTYASLRLKLDAWSSAVHGGQRRQKCSSPTRR